ADAERAAEGVREQHAARLERRGIGVRDVVTDHVQVPRVRVEPRQAGEERGGGCHGSVPVSSSYGFAGLRDSKSEASDGLAPTNPEGGGSAPVSACAAPSAPMRMTPSIPERTPSVISALPTTVREWTSRMTALSPASTT